jgi:hypothetical protein
MSDSPEHVISGHLSNVVEPGVIPPSNIGMTADAGLAAAGLAGCSAEHVQQSDRPTPPSPERNSPTAMGPCSPSGRSDDDPSASNIGWNDQVNERADAWDKRQVLPFTGRQNRIDEPDLAGLLYDHERMRDLCDELERLADGLPGHPSLMERRTVAKRIERTTVEHVKTTSSFLRRFFSAVEPVVTRGVLSRILMRQVSDAVHAEDIAETLRAEHLDAATIDMLGYMLRCLFENCRRALEFEGLFLLSLGGSRLTPSARRKLERALG